MTLDPVTLAVIENGLNQICSEMDLVHEKTSFSPVISEGFDRSNGIYALENGQMIAQGALGLPIFLGVMQFATEAVIELRNDLGPGDIVIQNDPYLGGTHLMDVKMVMPFYYRGRPWCYLSNTGHWPDTGGMVPGGFNSTATEIQQEGLRLPPVKLMEGGELCQDIIDIILTNIRVPEERIGDIRAQIGALRTGEKRLTALLDRYGAATVEAAIAELRARSEMQMRACIEALADGTYSFTSYVDSDGVVNEPLAVALDMTVQGSDITFDFSRASPPCRGPMNCVWATTQSAVYVAMKHIFPDVPINSGCFAPLHIPKPGGTFLYAEYPRPVAGCAAEVAQRIMEAVFGAMGQIIPERMFAAPAGTSGNLALGGYDPEEDRNYIMYLFSGGGYGGWWETDGLTNGCSTVGISQDPTDRNSGAALSVGVRGIRAARGLRRRRPSSRRLRRELSNSAGARRGQGLFPDGPWPFRSARPDGRSTGRHQPDRDLPRRQCGVARAHIKRRRLHSGARRLGAGANPRRRRLRLAERAAARDD